MNPALFELLDRMAPTPVRLRDPHLWALARALDVGFLALVGDSLVLTEDGQRALDGARAERLVLPR